jgi:hypothetical protein
MWKLLTFIIIITNCVGGGEGRRTLQWIPVDSNSSLTVGGDCVSSSLLIPCHRTHVYHRTRVYMYMRAYGFESI